jgi:hypothetical protein
MIIGISKENGDRILENFLVGASKVNGSVECAKESIEIMDKFEDSQLIVSLLVSNSIRSLGQIPERVVNFEVEVLSALTTMFTTCDESDIPAEFEDLFLGTEDEVLDKVSENKKIHFAVQAFVNAFYTFDKFEKQYPEITKML